MWNEKDISARLVKPSTMDSAAHRDRKRASVALVLATDPTDRKPSGTSLLVIERAAHEGDPWSGHMAFPGGRREQIDKDLESTAMRETREETGLALDREQIVGQLDDIDGRHSSLIVSCFVFSRTREAALKLNHEVAQAFWVPLDSLLDRRNLVDYRPPGGRWTQNFPGIRVGDKDNHVIWGLTYRLIRNFLQRVEEVKLPPHNPPPL